MDVSEPASISKGIAERYATALFELALDENALDALQGDIEALDAALAGAPEFVEVINSPIYSREAQSQAVQAVAEPMGLSQTMTNTLALMGAKRRLFVLPQLVQVLREKLAAHRGETTAEVASAAPLTDAQATKLADLLKAKVGKDVKIKMTVDESLIGGLVVKVGSRMIDTSVAAKLATLQNAMKEVG